MKLKDIPISVDQIAVRERNGCGCVVAKITVFLGGPGDAADLRKFFIDEVLPRPEIGTPVDLEGLDTIPTEERTPEQSMRLDRLAWRRSQKIRISCAPPKVWWEHVRVKLWAIAPEARHDEAQPVVALYPASADGKVAVEVRGDEMSATISWCCKAELAELAIVAEVAKLLDRGEDGVGAGAWLDLSFEASQLELFASPSADERSFARAATQHGIRTSRKTDELQ